MKRERQVTKTEYVCDGCDYLMTEGDAAQGVRVIVPFDYEWAELRDGNELEFNFHTLANRHDCFRYWAHNARIMERSLKKRQLSEDEIETFMALMLYRKDKWSPGVAKGEVA